MEFISITHTNTVNASGATNLCGSPWKMPFTWSVMKSKHELDEGLALGRARPGRALGDPPEEPQADEAQQHRDDQGIEIQRPEAALADRLGREREVVTDVLGGVLVLGGHA